MKLRNKVRDGELRQVDTFVLRFKTGVEVYGPLAGDVV